MQLCSEHLQFLLQTMPTHKLGRQPPILLEGERRREVPTDRFTQQPQIPSEGDLQSDAGIEFPIYCGVRAHSDITPDQTSQTSC